MSYPNIYILIYDGFELLDLAGPTGVFQAANEISGKRLYGIDTISAEGGDIRSSCGLSVASRQLEKVIFTKRDTVLVVGAYQPSISNAYHLKAHRQFLRKVYPRLNRLGSVCSGAFLLGGAGLFDNKKVTSHWFVCNYLQQSFPTAKVKAESLYLNDGDLWTSGGVTTGIDMCLAMLRQDHGSVLMNKVARSLVVHAHRPGYQSQYSSLSDSLSTSDGQFHPLISWLEENLHRSIHVSQMAERTNLSLRTFQRKFTQQFGISPSKYLESMRLQRARDLLQEGKLVKQILTKVGFNSEAAFRRAYENLFGVAPSRHKLT